MGIEKDFRTFVRNLRNGYLKRLRITDPCIINNGHCLQFHKDIKAQYPDAEMHGDADHIYTKWRGKYYDAEAVNGVKSPRELHDFEESRMWEATNYDDRLAPFTNGTIRPSDYIQPITDREIGGLITPNGNLHELDPDSTHKEVLSASRLTDAEQKKLIQVSIFGATRTGDGQFVVRLHHGQPNDWQHRKAMELARRATRAGYNFTWECYGKHGSTSVDGGNDLESYEQHNDIQKVEAVSFFVDMLVEGDVVDFKPKHGKSRPISPFQQKVLSFKSRDKIKPNTPVYNVYHTVAGPRKCAGDFYRGLRTASCDNPNEHLHLDLTSPHGNFVHVDSTGMTRLIGTKEAGPIAQRLLGKGKTEATSLMFLQRIVG